MGRHCVLLLLCVVLAVAFLRGARGQGPSPAPSTVALGPSGSETPMAPAPSAVETPLAPGPAGSDDCMTVLEDNLFSCLTYVEAKSNLTRPEKGCCEGFTHVVNTRPLCLCSLLSSTNVVGIPIDRTKSLKLPTVCGVRTPPVSLCSVLGVPASSPEGSTSPPTGAPMGLGATTAPATAGGPTASPPTGNGADSSSRFTSLAPFVAAGLAFSTVAIF